MHRKMMMRNFRVWQEKVRDKTSQEWILRHVKPNFSDEEKAILVTLIRSPSPSLA